MAKATKVVKVYLNHSGAELIIARTIQLFCSYFCRCTLSVKPVTTQACEVPCPIDCEVTEYSDWSPCDSECWEGKIHLYTLL